MSEQSSYNNKIENKFVIGLAVAFSLMLIWMVKDFILALFLAAITAGLVYKFFRYLRKKFNKEGLAAGITTVSVFLLFIIPLIIFAGIVIDQAIQISKDVAPMIEEQVKATQDGDTSEFELPDWMPEEMKNFIQPYKDDILKRVASISGSLGKFVVNQLTAITKGSFLFFIQLFIFLYALYFFLIDGSKYIQTLRKYIPMDREDFDLLLSQGLSITRATLKGAILIGVLQGSLIGAAFAVLGIKGAAFWGAISIVLSLIPSIGSGFVWVPFAIFLLSKGDTTEAILLTIWGVVFVGLIDNILRPKLVGQDTKMSDLLILLSTLGGITLFGITGFIVGPILAGLTLTVWKIYGENIIDDYSPDNLPDEDKVDEILNFEHNG